MYLSLSQQHFPAIQQLSGKLRSIWLSKLEASCIHAWGKIAGNHLDTGWYQLANWLIPAKLAGWLAPDGPLAV